MYNSSGEERRNCPTKQPSSFIEFNLILIIEQRKQPKRVDRVFQPYYPPAARYSSTHSGNFESKASVSPRHGKRPLDVSHDPQGFKRHRTW
jgi:hypothetical protein